MNLLIMRHGIAEPGGNDFHRSLTEEGIRGVRRTAALLSEQLAMGQGRVLSKIIASPLLRSQQTAQIVKEVLKLDSSIETLELIRPESDIEDFQEYLKSKENNALRENDELCLYVSHQPFVGLLMYSLSGTEEFMDTADLNCVSIGSHSKGRGELIWKISA